MDLSPHQFFDRNFSDRTTRNKYSVTRVEADVSQIGKNEEFYRLDASILSSGTVLRKVTARGEDDANNEQGITRQKQA